MTKSKIMIFVLFTVLVVSSCYGSEPISPKEYVGYRLVVDKTGGKVIYFKTRVSKWRYAYTKHLDVMVEKCRIIDIECEESFVWWELEFPDGYKMTARANKDDRIKEGYVYCINIVDGGDKTFYTISQSPDFPELNKAGLEVKVR